MKTKKTEEKRRELESNGENMGRDKEKDGDESI